jgi:hypothetical protein
LKCFDHLLDAATGLWQKSYGSGSRLELRARFASTLELGSSSVAPTDVELLRLRIEQEHLAHFGARRLSAELEDEQERDAALAGDRALVAYERKWAKRLVGLQRVHPRRWCLPGLSDAELRDELTLRLIDGLRGPREELARYERAGKEWGLVLLSSERRRLRRDFRLNVVLAEPPLVFDRALTGEEHLLEGEHDALLARAREQAECALSRPQRSWYAAMLLTAQAGAFFEASGRLNLSEVSRTCGKNRSSATRAFEELKRVFTQELEKLT